MARIDAEIAARLGFPKLKYAQVERERRWLCDHIPMDMVVETEAITDLYVSDTCLRVREVQPLNGGEPQRRLGRKAEVDPYTRLQTSVYLSEVEFKLLAGLPGRILRKTRHRLAPVNGVTVAVDRFEGNLDGLILAEAEFESEAAMAGFPMPSFAVRDVTEDARYSGGRLVADGLPR